MNVSKDDDNVFIFGTHLNKQAFYIEENILVTKRLYLKGYNGKPIISCERCDMIFHISSSVNFEDIRFSYRPNNTSIRERSTFLAFKVYDSSFKLSNCYFDNIPQGMYIENKNPQKLIFYNIAFKNSLKAIEVKKMANLILLMKKCQFLGPSIVSGKALTVKQDTHTGSGYLHMRIQGCTFKSLQIPISVDYGIGNLSISIQGSTFINNDMRELARSFYDKGMSSGITILQNIMTPVEVKSNITISTSTFINNTSIYGSSISIECGQGMNVIISNCFFSNNIAFMSGGAIRACGNCNLTLHSSTFLNNSCNVDYGMQFRDAEYPLDPYGKGGALWLFDYEKSPFDPFEYHPEAQISDCVFKNNSADYSGGAIYTNTHIVNITSTVIESPKLSATQNIDSELIRCKYRCNLKNVTFVIGTAVDGRIAALFGESMLALRLDQQSTFICPKGSILFQKNLPVLGDKEESLSTEQDFFMFAVICLKCPLDHYNLDASFLRNMTGNNQICHKCSLGGLCESGIIRPKSNFWGYRKNGTSTVNFIQLAEGYGCDKKQCRQFDSCANGRRGKLCGTCKRGLTESMLSPTCISNSLCDFTTFWALAGLLFLMYLVFFIYKKEIVSILKINPFVSFKKDDETEEPLSTNYARMQDDSIVDGTLTTSLSTDSNEGTNRRPINSTASTAIIKILFYFYQIESLLRTFRYRTDSKLSSKFVQGSFRSFFSFDFLDNEQSSACAIYNATPIDKILIRLAFVTCLLLALIVLFFLTNYCHKKSPNVSDTSTMRKGNLSLSNRIVVASFEVFLLNYALFANTILKLLNCVDINGDVLLYVQGDIRCYQGWQYMLIVLVLIWVLPFCVFIFMLPGLLLYRGMQRDGLFLGCVFPLLPLIREFLRINCFSNQSEQVQEDTAYETYTGVNQEARLEDRCIEDPALSDVFQNRTSPFSEAVNRRLYFSWEGAYILRRLVIVVLFTFIKDPIYKLYSILMMQVVFLLHHIHMKPYASNAMNHLETASLTTLVLINSMNLFSVYGYSHGIAEEGDKLILLEAFSWIQVIIGMVVPVIIIFPLAVLILIYLICLVTKAGKFFVKSILCFI